MLMGAPAMLAVILPKLMLAPMFRQAMARAPTRIRGFFQNLHSMEPSRKFSFYRFTTGTWKFS